MTTIKLKNGSGAPLAGDLVQGEPALDLTNKRLYTENSSGTVIEVGTNPTSVTTGAITSTGIDVTGTVTADGLTVDGAVSVTNVLTVPVFSTTTIANTRGLSIYNNQSGGFLDTTLVYGNSVNSYFAVGHHNGTSYAERMRIDAGGNVGIAGQTNPTYKLDGGFADQTWGWYLNSGYNAGMTYTTSDRSLLIHTKSAEALDHIKFATGTAATERMRIDASGNLLVGTTDDNVTNNSGNTPGINIGVAGIKGFMSAARYQGPPLSINRLGNDGDIQLFSKDGLTVGSIGVDSGDNLYVGGSAASHSGLYFGTNTAAPITAGTLTDAVTDLGTAGYRFKDLHMSGNAFIDGNVQVAAGNGILLGGTATANKLDDYEEGTWTPVVRGSSSNPTVSYTSQQGTYTKVGNLVTVSCFISLASISGGSGDTRIGGLPFNQTATNNAHLGNSAILIDQLSGDFKQVSLQGGANDELIIITNGGSTATHAGMGPSALSNSSTIRFVRTYFAS